MSLNKAILDAVQGLYDSGLLSEQAYREFLELLEEGEQSLPDILRTTGLI